MEIDVRSIFIYDNWPKIRQGPNKPLYVDGVEVARDAGTLAPLKSSDGDLHIGAGKSLDAGNLWSGLIDDVRIYDQALSVEEIAKLAR